MDNMVHFTAQIELIGVNPFVYVPEEILSAIFLQAGKDKGKIPIHGTVNQQPYRQTLVKYSGHWRLYINTTMLKNSPKRIGETIAITIAHDTTDRKIHPHPRLIEAINNHQEAQRAFDGLRPSLQHEIVRYIASLKTEESINRNIIRAVDFLLGKGRFVGRDKP